jgi:signal transduction histidine kinase
LLFGAWCVSPYVWIAQTLFGIPILVFRLRALDSLDNLNIFDIITTVLVGPLLSGLILWIASITILRGRFRTTQYPVVVLAVWLLAACLRGLSATVYLNVQNVPSNLSPGQLISGVLFHFGWTILLTYIIASSNFYRLRSFDVDAALEVTRRFEAQLALVVQQESDKLNRIIRDWLIPELNDLRHAVSGLRAGAPRSTWNQVSARTGGIIIDQVRSASREVFDDTGEELDVEPRTKMSGNHFASFFSDLRSMELSVWLSTALYVGYGALLAVPRLGIAGYLLIASITFSGLLLLLLARWVLRKLEPIKFRGLSTVAVYVFTSVTVSLIVPWLPGSNQVDRIGTLEIFIVVFGVIGGIAASAIRQYQQRWEEYFKYQLELVEHYRQLDANLAREQLRVQRQTSRLLHGPVQGNLAATTLCLRLHAARPEAEFLANSDSAITRALNLLDEALATLDSTLSEPVVPDILMGDYLETLRSAWSGLIRIDCLVEPEVITIIDNSPSQSTAIIAILEEAVTNASRHGDARFITITITALPDANEVVVIVENDGVTVSSDFQPGSGLHTFDALGAKWSLESSGSQSSRLQVFVPLS